MVLFVNIMYLADNLDVRSRPSLALRFLSILSININGQKKRGSGRCWEVIGVIYISILRWIRAL